MWEKYKVNRDKRGFIMETITDPGVRMGTLILVYKMIHNCRASVVLAYLNQLAGWCKKGVCYNWSQYLCEELLDNVCKA